MVERVLTNTPNRVNAACGEHLAIREVARDVRPLRNLWRSDRPRLAYGGQRKPGAILAGSLPMPRPEVAVEIRDRRYAVDTDRLRAVVGVAPVLAAKVAEHRRVSIIQVAELKRRQQSPSSLSALLVQGFDPRQSQRSASALVAFLSGHLVSGSSRRRQARSRQGGAWCSTTLPRNWFGAG